MFTMITLDSVSNIPYEILTKLTKMHWTCVKQCKIGRNNLNNTHKSGGKSLQKMLFYLDMLVIFPPGLDWLLYVMALGTSSLEKTEMTHGWQLAMHHMVKSWLNHFKIKFRKDLELWCHFRQRSLSEYHFWPRKQCISMVLLTTAPAQRGISPIQW